MNHPVYCGLSCELHMLPFLSVRKFVSAVPTYWWSFDNTVKKYLHVSCCPGKILLTKCVLKGQTQLWKSRRIYPKYMPKCSVGSTDHVCKIFTQKILRNVEDIDVWNFRQERFMLRHLRQWSKNFGFGSALSHNSGAAKYDFVYYSNVQRTFKDGKIKSTVFTRPHAMKRHKFTSPIGTNWDFIILDACQLWKSNILSTRKLRVLWPILWHISLTST